MSQLREIPYDLDYHDGLHETVAACERMGCLTEHARHDCRAWGCVEGAYVRLPSLSPMLLGWVRQFLAWGYRPRLRLHADGTATLYRPTGWR